MWIIIAMDDCVSGVTRKHGTAVDGPGNRPLLHHASIFFRRPGGARPGEPRQERRHLPALAPSVISKEAPHRTIGSRENPGAD
jgi:hypothetical protein